MYCLFFNSLKRKQQVSHPSHDTPLSLNELGTSPAAQSRQGDESSTPFQHPEDEFDATLRRSEEWGTAGLQPVSILSKEAQSGKFSLGNILCVPDAQNSSQPPMPLSRYGHVLSSRDDPIAFHILTFPVALGLFDRCVGQCLLVIFTNALQFYALSESIY